MTQLHYCTLNALGMYCRISMIKKPQMTCNKKYIRSTDSSFYLFEVSLKQMSCILQRHTIYIWSLIVVTAKQILCVLALLQNCKQRALKCVISLVCKCLPSMQKSDQSILRYHFNQDAVLEAWSTRHPYCQNFQTQQFERIGSMIQ